ncbi:urease accessory protein UreH [Teredinibacter purpureus]|uniref:urease accessory protein UreH n=1 Tax=Teredinibacter purpureus TaxID=2731756 RepID=UPI0005F7CC8B|nr:urease accessory protein UreH [Teredinibacter purpureus]
MDTTALTSFLMMGLALGVVHAFDPDHVAAVGGLTSSENQRSCSTAPRSRLATFRFGLHWSLGHGFALLLVSLLVLLAGSAIPVNLSEFAERAVAYALILIGLFAFRRLFFGEKKEKNKPLSTLGAPFVGLLHGTAGSAPLLALLPLAELAQPAMGIIYVLFFSAGVAMAMTALSGVFAHSMRIAVRCDWPLHALFQGFVAAFSLFLGLYLVFFPT